MGWIKRYGNEARAGGQQVSAVQTVGGLNVQSNAVFNGGQQISGVMTVGGLNVQSAAVFNQGARFLTTVSADALRISSSFFGGDKYRGLATIPVGSLYTTLSTVLITASVVPMLTEITVTVSDQARRPAYVSSVVSGVSFAVSVNSAPAAAQVVGWFIVS